MTSRRTLLKAGVAALALTGLRGSMPAIGLGTVPELLANDTYPIGFFWPPPPGQTTLPRYQEIANAGFTFVNSGNDVYDWELSRLMMAHCADTGLVALPTDRRVSNAKICPGWEDGVRRIRDQYAAESPSFGGFRLVDEPSPVEYPRLRMIVDVLAQAGPTDLSHVNVVPVYDVRRRAEYQEFLARYQDQLALPFLSFDHYPLLTDNTLRASFFLNWALIRAAGLRANVPTWTYIQTVEHWNIKRPTAEELHWQISMALAYGCKGIQYFTYWSPGVRPDFNFGPALLDVNGNKTDLYDVAQAINVHWLRPHGRELKHLVSESVAHANEQTLPVGATAFTASAQLKSVEGAPVVLGQFRTAADDGRRWLFVANRSYARGPNATSTITVQPGIGQVERYTPVSGGGSGQYTPVQLSATRSFTASIQPGSGNLYRLTPAAAG